MNTMLKLAFVLAAVTLLSACGHHEPGSGAGPDDHALPGTIHLGALGISPHTVTIHRDGYPDAKILAEGRLVIGDQDVPLTDSQRTQVLAYHAAAMQLREHGKETGLAGARVGAAAAGAVVSGLLKGDPDSIGPKVQAKAELVKQSARRLCDDIDAMRRAQDALATALDAFRPYATLKDGDVADCREGIDEAPG